MPRPTLTDVDGRPVTRPPAKPRPDPEPPEGRWTWAPIVRRELDPIVYDVWLTQADERVCPECGPLAGVIFREGFGPQPPLHVNCRCTRSPDHSEFVIRLVTLWERRWIGPTDLVI